MDFVNLPYPPPQSGALDALGLLQARKPYLERPVFQVLLPTPKLPDGTLAADLLHDPTPCFCGEEFRLGPSIPNPETEEPNPGTLAPEPPNFQMFAEVLIRCQQCCKF